MTGGGRRGAIGRKIARAVGWFSSQIDDLFTGGASKRFALIASALGLALLAGIWFMLDVLPDMAVGGDGLTVNERLQRENDVRTTGLQALGGFVLALGGAFTAYSVLSNREDQLDERFARSLELMTSDQVHVFSGAVFSLERIAVQSRFDRAAVLDVLCGFLRSQDSEQEPRPEALQTLRVVGRVKELWQSPEPDLRRTGWKKAQLSAYDLSGMLLMNSVFTGANLYRTDLSRSRFFQAKFASAVLLEAKLVGADLSTADLSAEMLGGADLRGANLFGVSLKGAYLDGYTKLDGANLSYALLEGLRVHDADLSQVRLEHAKVEGAKYTADARFPDGFDPGDRGMILEER